MWSIHSNAEIVSGIKMLFTVKNIVLGRTPPSSALLDACLRIPCRKALRHESNLYQPSVVDVVSMIMLAAHGSRCAQVLSVAAWVPVVARRGVLFIPELAMDDIIARRGLLAKALMMWRWT